MSRTIWITAFIGLLLWDHNPAAYGKQPDVLFIAIDDLNDWVAATNGNQQAKTPSIDRFVEQGAVVFQNAYCAGPVCGPSRSALLSGFMPHTTGIYGNKHNMLRSPLVQQHATLPEYFAKQGYKTVSRGKIFHGHDSDKGAWAFQDWSRNGGVGVDRTRLTSRNKNLIRGKPAPPSEFTARTGSPFEWGPTRGDVEETSDRIVARWAVEQLNQSHDQPLFLAVGLFRPHLPFFAPQEFFDLYPIDSIQVPEVRADDLDDILLPSGKPAHAPSADYRWLNAQNLFREVTQAYLAMVSYADSNLGIILNALETSGRLENTIVVLWGDHGWHLGEKLRYRKATGWIESTRVPLIIRLPGMTQPVDCHRPVNLIDLFPTLIDLCDLPSKPELDGYSMARLLQDPSSQENGLFDREFSTTIFGPQNVSITDGKWHWIETDRGTRELYDLQSDPMEWDNLADRQDERIAAAQRRLSAAMPTQFARPILANDAAKNSPSQARDLETLR
ncbi:MAG: sulfatase [Planctomycetota bacterium]